VVPTQASPEQVLEYCGEEPSWICRWVLDNTESETLATASDVLLARPLRIAVIIIVAFVLSRLVRRGIRRLTDRMANPDVATLGPIGRYTPSILTTTTEVNLRSAARAETLKTVLRSIASFVIWTFAALMVLGELNINLGPLIAGAGVAGVALGFGAQSLVRDFLSGIFMLIEDQYGVGDVIDVGEAVGVVETMTLRTTKLRSVDGAVWHVPNGEIRRVGNMSQQWSRALLDVEVAYSTDLTHAREVIARVCDVVYGEPEWRGVILEPPEIWGVERFGADAIAIRVVLKTKPGEQWRLQREVRARLKEAFDAEGIEIPFAQRTVWLRQEPPTEERDGAPPAPEPEPASPPKPAADDPHQAKGDPAEPPPAEPPPA
jgi:moderate conductance mechanosensitive channel